MDKRKLRSETKIYELKNGGVLFTENVSTRANCKIIAYYFQAVEILKYRVKHEVYRRFFVNDQTERLELERAAAWNSVIKAFDGDSKLAKSWLNEPIEALGNEKPVDYMNSLDRIRVLRSVIAKLEHGFP